MTHLLTIVLAQQNYLLGDIEGNAEKIIDCLKQHPQADVIIFPELSLTGYPPEDLLLRPECHQRVHQALGKVQQQVADVYVVLGHPWINQQQLYNAASVIHQQQIIATYKKQHLPNYSVFDEKRYFHAGRKPCVIDMKGVPVGISICEDLWHPGTLLQAAKAGARGMISLNTSPYHMKKPLERVEILRKHQQAEAAIPIFYVNCVGGQDELVFDGHSFVMDADGHIAYALPGYQEHVASISVTTPSLEVRSKSRALPLTQERVLANIYATLVLGVRDYVQKNGFPGVLLGLSGGIDSALTLSIAVDALGPEKVHAVMMPSRYSADISLQDATQLVKNTGVTASVISIEPSFQALLDSLAPAFQGLATDVTEENLQARVRGVLLMALSNKTGKLVLTTGNKSEMAVGYATLYGDMAGGFAVLKDVLKTQVYQLANFRNQTSPIIPQRIIDRPPSAELATQQTDQDTLPPYPLLDDIITRYVEHNQSADDIIAEGFSNATVHQVIALIDRNEYKRRQAPPGPRISQRAFGRDWRYPITSGFNKTRKATSPKSP